MVAIVKKNRDPVSLLNPEVQEEMTELIGAKIDLLVGIGALLID